MDKEIEMTKLQIVAQHYESLMQNALAFFLAFEIALFVLVMELYPPKEALAQVPGNLIMVLLMLGVPTLVLYGGFWWFTRRYKQMIRQLDRYVADVENGKAIPPLKDLIA